VAHDLPRRTGARDRLNSNVIWVTVTFVLNVIAFLIMGLQARMILTTLASRALEDALISAGIVLGVVILVRFVWVMAYGAVVRRFRRFVNKQAPSVPIPMVRVGVLVSWCGMRGLVTLATAFALPPEFPKRDFVVLSAFVVVLGTLVLQGFTIRPLIAWLKIEKDPSLDLEVAEIRNAMFQAGLAELRGDSGPVADEVRREITLAGELNVSRDRPITPYDALRRRALSAERKLLNDRRDAGLIFDDVFHHLEDELDRLELDIASPGASYIED
jgi:NhaP-type Na+/H+ or K+/H+ antiporter